MFFRWNRSKGNAILANNSYWLTNEPDITEFDYSIRETSPITKEAFRKCSSNPTVACSVSQSFSCDKQPDAINLKTPSYSIPDDAATSTMCPDSSDCKGAVNSLFVSFDLVKATTPDATPACMALLGPKVDQHIKDANFDQCGLLFDFQSDNGEEKYDYAKWMDLKCSQRTRSLMCTLLGISNIDISKIKYFESIRYTSVHIVTHTN